jgi:hypothetical protein
MVFRANGGATLAAKHANYPAPKPSAMLLNGLGAVAGVLTEQAQRAQAQNVVDDPVNQFVRLDGVLNTQIVAQDLKLCASGLVLLGDGAQCCKLAGRQPS